MQSIIDVRNLNKSFNGKKVVDNISFCVEKGSFFAFLGQNGAGKSTTINMIIGLLTKDGGEISYDTDKELAAFKSKIGVVFQNNVLDDVLTVEENLLTYGAMYIYSRQRVKEEYKKITEMFGLREIEKQRFKTLSGGQKRKAEIARALFMSPEILFLDEPTTGLDPKTRAEVWNIIGKLMRSSGLTVFLTTHYMEEAAKADDVAIIDRGRIIAIGTPAELKQKYTFDRLTIKPKDPQKLIQQLEGIAYEKTADAYAVKIENPSKSIDLLSGLKDNIESYEVIKGSMDDVFLTIVGEKLENVGGTL